MIYTLEVLWYGLWTGQYYLLQLRGSPPPPPAADMEDSEEESVSIDSVGGQNGIAQTKLDGGDKLMMSDDDDMWDSVLQESGMVSYTTVYYNRV